MAGLKNIVESMHIDGEGLAELLVGTVTEQLVHRFVDVIEGRLIAGKCVTIRGLGTFRLTKRKARTYKTALMSVAVTKPDRFTVTFKPSDLLLAKLPTP